MPKLMLQNQNTELKDCLEQLLGVVMTLNPGAGELPPVRKAREILRRAPATCEPTVVAHFELKPSPRADHLYEQTLLTGSD